MFLLVMLHHITPARAMQKKSVEKSATEKSKKATDEQPTFQQSHNDGVVPSVTFHFDNQVLVTPPVVFEFPISEIPSAYSSKPLYRISYFEKLFGHHIAVNAP